MWCPFCLCEVKKFDGVGRFDFGFARVSAVVLMFECFSARRPMSESRFCFQKRKVLRLIFIMG